MHLSVLRRPICESVLGPSAESEGTCAVLEHTSEFLSHPASSVSEREGPSDPLS